jgi:hypothetical protein
MHAYIHIWDTGIDCHIIIFHLLYCCFTAALRLRYSCVTAAGIDFRIVYDSTLQVMAPNALVALSQNDERAREPQILARSLLHVLYYFFF